MDEASDQSNECMPCLERVYGVLGCLFFTDWFVRRNLIGREDRQQKHLVKIRVVVETAPPHVQSDRFVNECV